MLVAVTAVAQAWKAATAVHPPCTGSLRQLKVHYNRWCQADWVAACMCPSCVCVFITAGEELDNSRSQPIFLHCDRGASCPICILSSKFACQHVYADGEAAYWCQFSPKSMSEVKLLLRVC